MPGNTIDWDVMHRFDDMEVMEDGPYVVIVGNFTNGHKVYGPFGTYETAFEWTDIMGIEGQEAWVTLLWAPKGREIIPFLKEQL